MAPATPRLRILSVGGNPVSAFLSWRLQATNACDVTLVWKSGYEAVAQYGISFKSKVFGNERFKPYAVVRTPEEAAQPSKAPFDYVLLCVKALPDVYDIAAIVESVVSAQHTCILINTTSALGVESYLEQRFPTNVVLSLVSGADIVQLGPSEFEHRDTTDIWVGAANKNPSIPATIQADMADALAMTLSSGQVDCQVSTNIRQQQFERMIGPVAFNPASVIWETPNHADLLEKVGVRELITSVINELVHLAEAQGCKFPEDFREKTMEQMVTQAPETNSIMYQDYLARRPMEIETYLGAPIKLAQEVKVTLPRVETLYAILHEVNQRNQARPAQQQPMSPNTNGGPPPRLSSAPTPRGPPMMNGGMKNGMGRVRAPMNGGPPPGMRRGPPPGGFPPRMPSHGNGFGPHGPPKNRRASADGNDLEEFSHLMLYDSVPEGGLADAPNGVYENPNGAPSTDALAMRERELALRERELAFRHHEFEQRRRQQRGPPPPGSQIGGFDEDDDEDVFDPMAHRQPTIDPDNFDMLSVTSRRNRRAPSSSQLRQNPEMGNLPPDNRGPRNMFKRPGMNKNRTSTRMLADVPGLHESIMSNSLMGYSSNRYGAVDRQAMNPDSRTNSLTAARLGELERTGAGGYGAYPTMSNGTPMPSRRASQSPGNPFSPGPRPGGRPSPPNGYASNGMPPPGAGQGPPGMRAPVPRHPPGHGNAVAPQQVEQHAGVSNLYPNKPAQVRSLTGSASASAGSGDSSHSAHLDSPENSAYSSQSSLGPRPAIGVR